MSEKIKYDPEDIESLLLNKEYDNLFPEEKEFVLKHLDDREEYDSMRVMLLQFSDLDDSNEITPNPQTLDLLMEEFVTEEKRGFKWWLNSLFVGIFPSDRSWYKQPGFQMAMATCIVVIGFVTFQNNDSFSPKENLAEAKVQTEQETAEEIVKVKEERPDSKIDENNEPVVVKKETLSNEIFDNLDDNKSNGWHVENEEEIAEITFKDSELMDFTLESKDVVVETEGTWEIMDETVSSEKTDNYTLTRTYTATDNCGNTSPVSIEGNNDDGADEDDLTPPGIAAPETNIVTIKATDNAEISHEQNGYFSNSTLGNASSDKQVFETSGKLGKLMEISQVPPKPLDTDLIGLLYTAE